MPVVDGDFAAGVLRNFRALFNTRLQQRALRERWPMLTNQVNSDRESESYNWFGTSPQLEDVTHGIVNVDSLGSYNFIVTNAEYQAAIEVKRTALERDPLNLIAPRIRGLSDRAANHPGKLILQLVVDNPNAYDGTAFFDDTRTIGDSGTIDNILTGTGTTIAQLQTDLAAASSAMYLFNDDKGEPMELIGTVIMCHPDLAHLFWQALNRAQGDAVNTPAMPAGGMGTFQASGYTVITNPYLTDTNDWYLFRAEGEEKPFIYQTEKTPVLESDTNPNSRDIIEKRTFLYSVYARYAVAVTDPRFGIRTTNT